MTYDKFLEKTEELQNKLVKELESIDKKIEKLNEEKIQAHESFRASKEKAFAEYEVFIRSENEKVIADAKVEIKEEKVEIKTKKTKK